MTFKDSVGNFQEVEQENIPTKPIRSKKRKRTLAILSLKIKDVLWTIRILTVTQLRYLVTLSPSDCGIIKNQKVRYYI